MKKLSIQGKATRYEQAIKVAQRFYNNSVATIKKELEDIFPELKESDDERIRKNIIATIHLYYGEPLEDEAKEMIAWLEKQDKNNMGISEATKQKLENNLNKALEKETSESLNEFLEKQGEHKPAWSEEDEKLVKNLISTLSNLYTRNLIEKETKEKYTDLLKSLKDRVQPQSTCKPSDEQMAALNEALYHVNDDTAIHISMLIGSLKKLREE